jgi:hypothetical protein
MYFGKKYIINNYNLNLSNTIIIDSDITRWFSEDYRNIITGKIFYNKTKISNIFLS